MTPGASFMGQFYIYVVTSITHARPEWDQLVWDLLRSASGGYTGAGVQTDGLVGGSNFSTLGTAILSSIMFTFKNHVLKL